MACCPSSFASAGADFNGTVAAIADSWSAFDEVAGNDRAPDTFAQFDLRFIRAKLAAAHDHAPVRSEAWLAVSFVARIQPSQTLSRPDLIRVKAIALNPPPTVGLKSK